MRRRERCWAPSPYIQGARSRGGSRDNQQLHRFRCSHVFITDAPSGRQHQSEHIAHPYLVHKTYRFLCPSLNLGKPSLCCFSGVVRMLRSASTERVLSGRCGICQDQRWRPVDLIVCSASSRVGLGTGCARLGSGRSWVSRREEGEEGSEAKRTFSTKVDGLLP